MYNYVYTQYINLIKHAKSGDKKAIEKRLRISIKTAQEKGG